MTGITVTARHDWFEPARRHEITTGATLAEIVRQCDVPHWLEEAGEVAINGEIIPPENWHKVRPKQGTKDHPIIVSIYPPVLQGGNQGSTKQIITIVASIALIAGAAVISGGALAPFLGAWAGTALGGAALGSPFGVSGTLKLPAMPC